MHYLKLCKQLEYLTQLYIEDPLTFYLKADGIILQVIASLIEHFSITHISETASLDALTINRIHQVIPGSGKSPGEGNGNPLQYSCLENPMDGGA